MSGLRKAILGKLTRARATIETLRQQGGTLTALEWEKGYAKALEEVLDFDSLNLRRHPRRPTSIPTGIVRIEEERPHGRTLDGTVLDLSVGGARVTTPMGLREGDLIELAFRLPGNGGTVALRGQVLRIEHGAETLAVGVEFREVPEGIREVLQAFCSPPPDTPPNPA